MNKIHKLKLKMISAGNTNANIYIMPSDRYNQSQTLIIPIEAKGIEPVSLKYYARDHVSDYQTVIELPVENIQQILISMPTANDVSYMLDGCKNLSTIDTTDWDTSNVTNMEFMFANCQSLNNLDLSNFDMSNVSNMTGMFQHDSKLTSIDTIFDFSNIVSTSDIQYMFEGCTALGINQAVLKFKNVYRSVFVDETTLRTAASIPSECVVEILWDDETYENIAPMIENYFLRESSSYSSLWAIKSLGNIIVTMECLKSGEE